MSHKRKPRLPEQTQQNLKSSRTVMGSYGSCCKYGNCSPYHRFKHSKGHFLSTHEHLSATNQSRWERWCSYWYLPRSWFLKTLLDAHDSQISRPYSEEPPEVSQNCGKQDSASKSDCERFPSRCAQASYLAFLSKKACHESLKQSIHNLVSLQSSPNCCWGQSREPPKEMM